MTKNDRNRHDARLELKVEPVGPGCLEIITTSCRLEVSFRDSGSSNLPRSATQSSSAVILLAVRQNSAYFFCPQICDFFNETGPSELRTRCSLLYDGRSDDEEGSDPTP
jgi:hypothetical protein